MGSGVRGLKGGEVEEVLLERAAQEFSRLQLRGEMRRGEGLPFIDAMRGRVERVEPCTGAKAMLMDTN